MPFDATPQDNTTELLREVRDRLAKPGALIKGKMIEGDRHCLMGWILEVTSYRAPDEATRLSRLTMRVMQALPPGIHHYHCPQYSLTRYNDEETTTQAEVVALLDRAIASS